MFEVLFWVLFAVIIGVTAGAMVIGVTARTSLPMPPEPPCVPRPPTIEEIVKRKLDLEEEEARQRKERWVHGRP